MRGAWSEAGMERQSLPGTARHLSPSFYPRECSVCSQSKCCPASCSDPCCCCSSQTRTTLLLIGTCGCCTRCAHPPQH
eukprot:1161097-Pelagomonas_calceolata.AAC.6